MGVLCLGFSNILGSETCFPELCGKSTPSLWLSVGDAGTHEQVQSVSLLTLVVLIINPGPSGNSLPRELRENPGCVWEGILWLLSRADSQSSLRTVPCALRSVPFLVKETGHCVNIGWGICSCSYFSLVGIFRESRSGAQAVHIT